MTGQFQLWKQGAFSTLTLAAVLLCGQPVKSMGQRSVSQKSVSQKSVGQKSVGHKTWE